MAKKTISYTADQIIIVDDKNKAEKLDLFEVIPDVDAIKTIRKEQAASKHASVGALTLLAHMLDNPRFDAYKGTTPFNEKITPEFRGALRDIEVEYMKPIFVADLEAKGQTPATIEKQWQGYSADLRTGTYALVKSYVSKLFCHMGKLPLHEGKLLPINAIKTILEQAKPESPETEGIAGRLMKIASDVENRTEKTTLGDIATAVAALKSMLATFEGLQREENERLTMLHSDGVIGVTQAAIAQAQAVPSVDAIEAMHDNGQIDDTTYQIMMLEHHNIDIVFEDDTAPL
jgi:hypothetical protein